MKSELILFIFAFTLVVACNKAPKETADTIYTNGKIYTVNEAQPWVQAIAIKDGKIREGRIKKKDPELRDAFVELGMDSKEAIKVKDIITAKIPDTMNERKKRWILFFQ